MRKQVYKCTCGLWSRREYTPIVNGVPTCPCGKPMRKGYKDIEPLPSTAAQNLIALRAAKQTEMQERYEKRKRKAASE